MDSPGAVRVRERVAGLVNDRSLHINRMYAMSVGSAGRHVLDQVWAIACIREAKSRASSSFIVYFCPIMVRCDTALDPIWGDRAGAVGDMARLRVYPCTADAVAQFACRRVTDGNVVWKDCPCA